MNLDQLKQEVIDYAHSIGIDSIGFTTADPFDELKKKLADYHNKGYASGFEVGEHVQILGRIQSRDYVKKISETETETRTAYEVSVSKLECLEDD